MLRYIGVSLVIAALVVSASCSSTTNISGVAVPTREAAGTPGTEPGGVDTMGTPGTEPGGVDTMKSTSGTPGTEPGGVDTMGTPGTPPGGVDTMGSGTP